MHSIADVSAVDGCTGNYRPSEADAEEIDSSVEHVSSTTHAAKNVKKQSTFPARRSQPEGSEKESVSAAKERTARVTKAAALPYGVNSSGSGTEKRKSMRSVNKQKDQSDAVSNAGEE